MHNIDYSYLVYWFVTSLIHVTRRLLGSAISHHVKALEYIRLTMEVHNLREHRFLRVDFPRGHLPPSYEFGLHILGERLQRLRIQTYSASL